MVGGDGANMVSNEKLTKKWKLWGLKLRGLSRNQIISANLIYQNFQRNKVNILGDFEIETLTHISATHAISKIRLKFQNRIPRDLDQKLDILRIRMIH